MTARVRRAAVATSSQTVGPFFQIALTADASLGLMAPPGTPGERLTLAIVVTDGDGAPVNDAIIELWQADASGRYVEGPARGDGTLPAAIGRAFTGFGRLPTDQNGACLFSTIRPGRVGDGQGGLQAAHLNVRLFMRGLLRQIDTRMYFEGDPALDEDAVLRLVPEERRATLLAHRVEASSNTWRFDIRLQGDRETVFFDL